MVVTKVVAIERPPPRRKNSEDSQHIAEVNAKPQLVDKLSDMSQFGSI
jgi:hypothetical protein